jgi:hypothetical protein
VDYLEGIMSNNAETVGDFKEITAPEKCRTYVFPAGEVTVSNVSRVCVRPSGSHRLETTSGEKYIIPSGWIAIKIDAETWSF